MKGIRRKPRYHVYMVEAIDGTYYTGYTNNLKNRIKLHNAGHGAKYLRGRSPVTLVYEKEYGHYRDAMAAERQIKKMPRKKKEELVRKHAKR